MNQPIILDHASGSEEEFFDLLHEPSDTLTLLLVIGEDEPALNARSYVHSLLENAPEDYKSVRFVFVPDVALVRSVLESLDSNVVDFDWNNLEQYAVLSISPEENRIAAAITAEKIEDKPARIKVAILKAFAGDDDNQ